MHCLSYYPLEVYVFPWNRHSGDANYYLETFFKLPEDICMSSIIFTIFRWYNTTGALIWLIILFSNLNEKYYETDSNYSNDLIVDKDYLKSKHKLLFENLILNSMLMILVILMIYCCWFEYFNPHLM